MSTSKNKNHEIIPPESLELTAVPQSGRVLLVGKGEAENVQVIQGTAGFVPLGRKISIVKSDE